MTTWLGLLALATAAARALRWARARVDGLGRPVGFPYVFIVLCAVLAVSAVTPGLLRHRTEGRLGRVASTLAGGPVRVSCQTWGQAFVDVTSELGYVAFGADGVPERATSLKRDPCRDLSHFRGGRDPDIDTVIAVHVLTHESMHMAGLTSESEAECAAVQRDAAMARFLGASPAQARALAARYWREIYPRMPSDYVRASCRAAGELDERLPDAPWS